ncbi:hypothetical protein C3942_19835 [Solimonas fluminis]|uniref:Uncharacterized protein n=1 Tax=Solimonas fluminis TaxID=2086571 RepID=A0A2S5TAX9_9GAMM|nr:hypothetical protein [Solimonas fluminis]PPE72150.1 hypothetical protein C3942_19835 [Solimonas fluminis]
MFERFRGAGTVLAGSLALLLAACGGGGGGGGSGPNGSAKSCSEQFSAEAAQADSTSCQPEYYTQCDSLDLRLPVNSMNPSECTKDGADGGVVAEKGSAGGTSYDMVRPANGGKKGLYVALHWRSGNGATMINNMRLSELAKARDLTVVAPDSPYKILAIALSDWDYEGAPEVISAVIADAKARAGLPNDVPVILAGVSSGAAAANRFFCAGNTGIKGLLLVASGKISEAESTECLSAAAAAAKAATVSPVAVVLVEGSSDPAYEDTVVNYGHFRTINGCPGAGTTVVLNEQVDINYSNNCGSGHGAAMVTVKDSGHNWPGMDRPIPPNPLTDLIPGGSSSGAMSIFGKVSYSFDATLQGYDLVRSLD